MDNRPKSLAQALAATAFIVLAGVGGFLLVERYSRAELQAAGGDRIGLYASTLDQVIERFRTLPFVLAHDERILGLLEAPAEPERVARANLFLQALTEESGAEALYVMDANGLTLAANNYDQPLGFVGHNYGFRPYFTDAVAHGTGQFFAIGVTTGEPGYFLSRAVRRGDRLLGVAIVKISLDPLEAEWRAAGEAVALMDKRGVLFLASNRDWKYRALRRLTAAERAGIASVVQYSGVNLDQPPLLDRTDAPSRGEIVEFPSVRDSARGHLVARVDLADYGWTLYAFSDLAPVWRAAGLAGTASALGASALLLLALWWRGRRTAIRAKLEAHDALERRVTERTQELVTANENLSREIDERRRAEFALKRAQDDLIQASKLAALGQMSAALAHEINQPLAALKTKLASAKLLLRNGLPDRTLDSIAAMDELVARMAELTQHLKTFARKDRGEIEPVDVAVSVNRALALTNAQLAAERVRVIVDLPAEGAKVVGNAIRLEQVLLNLIANAADALAGRDERVISISVHPAGGTVRVAVADSGPGIAAEHLPSIFDPFFTTKETGKGLGLGLSISYAIVEDHGGRLRARNRSKGGAEFSFDLPAAAAAPGAAAIGA